jgi:hypothetical protein
MRKITKPLSHNSQASSRDSNSGYFPTPVPRKEGYPKIRIKLSKSIHVPGYIYVFGESLSLEVSTFVAMHDSSLQKYELKSDEQKSLDEQQPEPECTRVWISAPALFLQGSAGDSSGVVTYRV